MVSSPSDTALTTVSETASAPAAAQAKKKQKRTRKPAPKNQPLNAATLAERRYLWTARVFGIISAISLCANALLVLTLFQLVPLARVEPFLLTFQSKSEQIVSIEPVRKDMASLKAVMEKLVRQYLLLRNTLVNDITEMSRRWGTGGEIRWMSDDTIYQEFSIRGELVMNKIRQTGLTREIDITNVTYLGQDNQGQYSWTAEFNTRDMLPESEEPYIQRWKASMKLVFDKQRVVYANRLKNPLGFKVTFYEISKIQQQQYGQQP